MSKKKAYVRQRNVAIAAEAKAVAEESRIWKDADGTRVSDDQMFQWLHNTAVPMSLDGTEYELIIGTDSHLHGRIYKFITVVCLYRKGRGGFYYYTTSFKDRSEFRGNYATTVRNRLFHEATLAVELAGEIEQKLGKKPVLHLDASPAGANELTSAFSDQLVGYAAAFGYEAFVKDWAFVASCVADKHSKA